jgi:hypothetical protein
VSDDAGLVKPRVVRINGQYERAIAMATTGITQIANHALPLQATGGADRQDMFGTPCSALALRAQTSFASQDRLTDDPLGPIVGRLHHYIPYEGPQMLAHIEDPATLPRQKLAVEGLGILGHIRADGRDIHNLMPRWLFVGFFQAVRTTRTEVRAKDNPLGDILREQQDSPMGWVAPMGPMFFCSA